MRFSPKVCANALSTALADEFARAYYGAVGQATKMGIQNAQPIYDDLSVRYEAQRANRPKKPAAA